MEKIIIIETVFLFLVLWYFLLLTFLSEVDVLFPLLVPSKEVTGRCPPDWPQVGAGRVSLWARLEPKVDVETAWLLFAWEELIRTDRISLKIYIYLMYYKRKIPVLF